MIEKENILRILRETKKALENNDTSLLKNLSNQTIHSASIYQDQDNISVAVTVYSLGKILERPNYKSLKGWNNFYEIIKNALDTSIKSIEKNDLKNFKENFIFIGKAINKISGRLKDYVQQVLEKAKVTKASRIYEHGISLGKTADLLGISLFELADYTGNTGIANVSFNQTIDVKKRIKIAEEIFS